MIDGVNLPGNTNWFFFLSEFLRIPTYSNIEFKFSWNFHWNCKNVLWNKWRATMSSGVSDQFLVDHKQKWWKCRIYSKMWNIKYLEGMFLPCTLLPHWSCIFINLKWDTSNQPQPPRPPRNWRPLISCVEWCQGLLQHQALVSANGVLKDCMIKVYLWDRILMKY